jgi:biotin carboxylase
VPRFCVVDPFDSGAATSIQLDFPFWIKPVKSFNSYLGFYVRGPDDLEHALARIRAGIDSLAEPFDYVLSMIELPPEIKPVTGTHCIAEEIISAGRQCTVEGWGFRGEYQVYGVIDSIRHPGLSTFARYQYPSSLPAEVQQQMADISCRVMRHLGFDGSHFNIEYFWEPDTHRIWLLEINSRISQSHSELFAKVDGAANHAVLVDLALGRRPNLPHREGPFRCAAKFYERAFRDAVVRRVPDRKRIEEIEARFPGAVVHLMVRPGTRLSDLGRQESYSYELAWIYMGASDEQSLLADHRALVEMLDIELELVASPKEDAAER